MVADQELQRNTQWNKSGKGVLELEFSPFRSPNSSGSHAPTDAWEIIEFPLAILQANEREKERESKSIHLEL